MVLSAQSANTVTYQKTAWIDKALVVLMVIALSVQGQVLFSFGGMEFTIGHALVGIVGVASVLRLAVSKIKPVFPSIPVNALYLTFVLITIVDTPTYGFGSLILKYVFQYLVLMVTLNLLVLFDAKSSEQLVMIGAWIVLGIVLLNAAMNFEAFAKYYSNPWDGHPKYPTIFSGGTNLEASWPVMLGAFCHNNRQGRIYLALVFCFAEAVQSRAGLMLAVCVIAYVVLIKDGFKPTLGKILGVGFVSVLAIVLILAGPRAIGAATRNAQLTSTQNSETSVSEDANSAEVQNSETSTSEDLSSSDNEIEDASSSAPANNTSSAVVMGRKGIWASSVDAFLGSPLFGYGAGNAMNAVRSVAHFYYWEDNVHNYPLQILLDFGLVGFLVFAFITVRFLIINAKHHFCNPYAAFIALYLIGGMVQFRGGELFVGFALAGVIVFGPVMQRNSKRYSHIISDSSAANILKASKESSVKVPEK